MSNTLLTLDKITLEVLRLAHEKASFLGTINRQFDASFNASTGKTGGSLRIRLPSEYTRRAGSRVMEIQDSVQVAETLTVATQDGVDMRFNSQELTLSMEAFSKQHLEPAVATLISGVESDVLQGCSKLVFNLAGTAGTAISSLTAVGTARAKLNQYLAPKDNNRAIQMDSVTMAALADGLKALFHDGKQLSEAFREGFITRTAMADYYENERVWAMTNGSDVACGIDAVQIANGDEGITVSGFATPTVGMVFTVAGMYACHPETKAAYTFLKQHVVKTGSTATAISTYPIYLTGARKNVAAVDGTDCTTVGFSSAIITCVGSASTTYVQSLMYHRDAFAFVTADLPLMDDAAKCVRRELDGLSVRLWQASDIRNDEMLTRIDILYGYKAIRPQWACRLIGSAS